VEASRCRRGIGSLRLRRAGNFWCGFFRENALRAILHATEVRAFSAWTLSVARLLPSRRARIPPSLLPTNDSRRAKQTYLSYARPALERPGDPQTKASTRGWAGQWRLITPIVHRFFRGNRACGRAARYTPDDRARAREPRWERREPEPKTAREFGGWGAARRPLLLR
jgi:hypothetical protein